MAAKIEVYRGTTYDFNYHHVDSAGAAVTLVGSTIYFTVKADKYDTSTNDATALIKKTISSHTNAAGGISNWTINDADTWITPGKYYFDVIVEDADGLSAPPSLIGTFTVLPIQSNRQVGNE